jgi:hypothetical protein
MRSTVSLRAAAVLCGALVLAAPSHKSPFVQIVGEGTVVSAPRETKHKNGRKFLEFELTLTSAHAAAEQPSGADRGLALDTRGRVKVVHDLSCGGAAIALAMGDRVEIGGEYVHVPRGGDLIHFTHPADASGRCGHGGKHPAGFLRKAAPLRVPTATPRPVSLVPQQPYTGPPPAGERPYAAIVAAKEKGASEADLLAKVARDNAVYSLTTPEIQKLRAAGVSQSVIEAMLRSGLAATAAPKAP